MDGLLEEFSSFKEFKNGINELEDLGLESLHEKLALDFAPYEELSLVDLESCYRLIKAKEELDLKFSDKKSLKLKSSEKSITEIKIQVPKKIKNYGCHNSNGLTVQSETGDCSNLKTYTKFLENHQFSIPRINIENAELYYKTRNYNPTKEITNH